ncbi:MAG: hypothetical protein FWH57_01605 [Oscillospiraceae bacterium]|nr:hypothetical protein [Oscillospiraceae bacterium]
MINTNIATGINVAGYTDIAREAAATMEASRPGTAFQTILDGAMGNPKKNAGIAAGEGIPGMLEIPGISAGYLPIQNQEVEQAIMEAVSSGQIDDAHSAILMLCMIMQSNQDGEFAMLMQLMASMLTQIQGDAETLRNDVMSSEYDPYVLDTIDKGVFNTGVQNLLGTGGAIVPVEHWKPAIPVVTSDLQSRSPERYRAVIEQFHVDYAERYKPFRNGNTYCNIFVSDVTSAMGAQIPLYTDPLTGQPRDYPDIKGAKSMGAVAMDQWLNEHGATYGWREVDAETAQMSANRGIPAVTTAGGMGHVQIVCPSRNGEYDPVRGVTVAQAGRIVTNYTHITSIYGANSLNNSVKYWIHDPPVDQGLLFGANEQPS